MIAWLSGRVVEKTSESITLDVNGVGYRVVMATLGLAQVLLEENATLHIHTHVREDAITLYGFGNDQERGLFRQLISISGVGPKQAMSLLGGMPLADLLSALVSSNYKTLTTIPGIGKKKAERLCYELKNKLDGIDSAITAPTAAAGVFADLHSALTNLGYKQRTVDSTVQIVKKETDSQDFQLLLREALKRLR